MGAGNGYECSNCGWEFTEMSGFGFAGVEMATFWCPTCQDLRNCAVEEEPRCGECEGVVIPEAEAPHNEGVDALSLIWEQRCPRCGGSATQTSVALWD